MFYFCEQNKEALRKIEEIKRKWLKLYFDTSPCDRERAERLISQIYRSIGLPSLGKFVWTLSPKKSFEMFSKITAIKVLKYIHRHRMFSKLEGPGIVSIYLWVREHIISKEASIVRYVMSELRGYQGYKLGNYDLFFGSQEIFLSYWDFIFQTKKVKSEIKQYATLFMQLAECCGWWFPFEEVCICSEKPEKISVVDNKLHCDDGPAIKYRDGFSIWILNGIRVSRKMVESKGSED